MYTSSVQKEHAVFSWQQWLRERATMLRDTAIAHLVNPVSAHSGICSCFMFCQYWFICSMVTKLHIALLDHM